MVISGRSCLSPSSAPACPRNGSVAEVFGMFTVFPDSVCSLCTVLCDYRLNYCHPLVPDYLQENIRNKYCVIQGLGYLVELSPPNGEVLMSCSSLCSRLVLPCMNQIQLVLCVGLFSSRLLTPGRYPTPLYCPQGGTPTPLYCPQGGTPTPLLPPGRYPHSSTAPKEVPPLLYCPQGGTPTPLLPPRRYPHSSPAPK